MNQALDSIAKAALASDLKSQGFRKGGRTWRRRLGDEAVQVVNVQGSMFGTRAEGRCVLNLGVYFPALAEVLGVGRITDRPSEADCHLRRRAAMLGPDHRDTWFEFRSADPTSLERTAASLRELYIDFGAAWLRDLSTLKAASDEFSRTGQGWWAAAAQLCAGDKSGAASLLHRAIASAPKDIAPHLTRWGRQHSLL